MLEQGVVVLNAIGFVGFVALLGAATFKMAVRLVQYHWTGRRPSIILRRDILLLGGFFAVFGSAAVIRFFGWNDTLESNVGLRFLYLLAVYCISLGSLGYWTWAEFFVIGHDGKERD